MPDPDAKPPCLVLDAADEKNREGSTIPLRSDLAADLRAWLAYRLQTLQDAARNAPTVRLDLEAERRRQGCRGSEGLAGSDSIPTTLPPDTGLFTVPAGLVRILDRDLKAAGIPKRDERGRTVDVHAMRHTFGTLLSKSGAAPRTAQAAMRHSKIDLTMNTYTDPRLLDVAGAVESLPALPLTGGTVADRIAVKAIGTEDSRASEFAPKFAPTLGKRCKPGSIPGKMAEKPDNRTDDRELAVSAFPDNDKGPLTTAVNGPCLVGATGFEPATSWSRSSPQLPSLSKSPAFSALSRERFAGKVPNGTFRHLSRPFQRLN